MSRKKPSGDGSLSKRFAEVEKPDGTKLLVPSVKDAGTFLFMANEGGRWPAKPFTKLLYDAAWMQEGVSFELQEIAPGEGMGNLTTVRIIAVRNLVAADSRGRYTGFAQVKKQVLLTETDSYPEFEGLTLDDLEGDL